MVDRTAAMRAQCDVLERDISSAWSRGRAHLEKAASYVDLYIEWFYIELDAEPLFEQMPMLADPFEYLWAMFIQKGKPTTWLDLDPSGIRDRISDIDFIKAFAFCQVSFARQFLSEAESDAAVKPEKVGLAGDCLAAAVKALDFIGSSITRH